MKIKKRNFKSIIKNSLLGIAASSLLFTACNNEEDGTIEPEMPTGMLTVSDQSISQNTIVVSSANLEHDSWIVVHASEGGSPVVPDIISEPVLVEAGESSDIEITLNDFSSLSDGANVWVMLHTDDGEEGVYEFDGASGLDAPITTEEGEIVMSEITLAAPSITAGNQVVNENMVTIEEVNAAVDGWIVIHEDDGEGNPGTVLGQTFVEAGLNENVSVDLGDATFAGGEMLFPMLHIESPADGEYGFPDNGDGPEVFGENVIVVGMETTAATGSITAENQVVDANTITVSDLTVNATAWVVVHASNAAGDGPQVPEIISTPVQLEAGSNSDVEIELTETVVGGDELYIMLHTENGVIGEYEFDGANGFDGPITTEKITINAPTGSITASDQIIQGNTLLASNLTVDATAWVVVHASNEAGDGPQVPEIISTPVQLEAGSNDNVEIELTEAVNGGDVLYVMLHTENGTIGEYEFDGANGFDGPITTQAITIEAPTGEFTANNQTLTNGNVIVESITVGQPSWVVIHRDNGMGSFVAPGIISEPVALEAGTSTDVEISFADGETVEDGETLWIMLHNDNGVVGEYEFDGANGFDNPITFSDIEVSTATTINYDVTNDGTSSYIFTGDGLTDASNPDLTLVRGETYTFTVNASGHPFYINETQGTGTSNAYNNGVTNNGAQSGTVTFTVPNDAPNTLFYNCEFHSSMTGTIAITD
ncbi:hypothetical protein MATR_25200 [Marivirga tractuosa]|uniref:DUF7282 domain-containing protein n=2 Tax=Marivirga TaxID=869806 RepID=E4TPT7_MARTH|nr:hypothetical protein Ftrac_3655 [Marivirga tractuosa DSM 4126]BDD15695.1 hypothetical protein MATR_25200 [Marivirga tractuosa]